VRSCRSKNKFIGCKDLLHGPAIMDGWLSFFTAMRQKPKLGGRHRELAIPRVAR